MPTVAILEFNTSKGRVGGNINVSNVIRFFFCAPRPPYLYSGGSSLFYGPLRPWLNEAILIPPFVLGKKDAL